MEASFPKFETILGFHRQLVEASLLAKNFKVQLGFRVYASVDGHLVFPSVTEQALSNEPISLILIDQERKELERATGRLMSNLAAVCTVRSSDGEICRFPTFAEFELALNLTFVLQFCRQQTGFSGEFFPPQFLIVSGSQKLFRFCFHKSGDDLVRTFVSFSLAKEKFWSQLNPGLSEQQARAEVEAVFSRNRLAFFTGIDYQDNPRWLERPDQTSLTLGMPLMRAGVDKDPIFL